MLVSLAHTAHAVPLETVFENLLVAGWDA
jgi:hypothetical protein